MEEESKRAEVWVSPVSKVLFNDPTSEPREWSMVVFWKEGPGGTMPPGKKKDVPSPDEPGPVDRGPVPDVPMPSEEPDFNLQEMVL